jgi:hypothetical protein
MTDRMTPAGGKPKRARKPRAAGPATQRRKARAKQPKPVQLEAFSALEMGVGRNPIHAAIADPADQSKDRRR